jgi:cellulose synthase/poly-beta-1,6-N-acetylglucosamine synthase-like glycosyltransferase
MLSEVIFISSIFLVCYIYLGYPLLVLAAGKFFGKRVEKRAVTPAVTILIAAFNEEKVIRQTLENKLSLDFPKETLEILVVSDGSFDKTEEIVAGFKDKGVRLLRQVPRAGKTSALNLAVPEAKGEIIVFSDANSMYEKNALRSLVRNFADPSVGYVTGKMIYTNPDGTIVGDGCSTYMKYENLLREFETKIGSVVGVDGGIDAVRKDLYKPMNPDQLPDFVLPLKLVQQGYRVVYEPEAILKEASLKDPKDEYRMRVRVSLRAFWALWDMRELLSIRKFGLFAWQLWSHKLLRYISFVFLIAAYLTNLALWSASGVYKGMFVAQNLGYLFAALYPWINRLWQPLKGLYFLNYFLLLNLAAGHAFIKFLMGQKQTIWAPRKG